MNNLPKLAKPLLINRGCVRIGKLKKNEFPYSDLMHELSIFIFGIYGLPKLGNRYLYKEHVEKLQKSKKLGQ